MGGTLFPLFQLANCKDGFKLAVYPFEVILDKILRIVER